METILWAAFAAATPAPAWEPFQPARPTTYAEATRQSLATGKPLLIWVGQQAQCERCVNQTAGEFVHLSQDSFPEAVNPSIVVAVPAGGQLVRIADIRTWITGSATHGHIPSVRKALAAYRSPPAPVVVPAPAVVAPPPVMAPTFQPVSFRPAPRMMSRGRACAT